MPAGASAANAEDSDAAFDWTGIYAGIFVGAGQTDNRIVDIDGFANWGNPGSTLDYDDDGFVGGVLVGRKFEIGGMPLRIEIDGTFGDLSANTNRLDPEGLDETAATKFRWIATARGGIEQTLGPVTVFASGGVAAARIYNSVTDIDFGPNIPRHIDRDDSFRGSSTRIGWVIGLGVEAPLADAWTLRLEGSYLDFGRSKHYVNRSGNNRCGAEGPRRPCPYSVENKLGIVRLAIIRRFDL
jgi:opacity protein-like surface antigen